MFKSCSLITESIHVYKNSSLAQLNFRTMDTFSPTPVARVMKARFVPGQNVYEVGSFPRAAIVPHHREGGLEQQKFVVHSSGGMEVS